MRTPLDFLVKLRYLLLLLVLEAVCVLLIHRHGALRDNVVFTTAGSVAGLVCKASSSVSDYFGLRKENRKLTEEIAWLRSELYQLRDSAEIASLPRTESNVVVARVINNTISKNNNFITIDKGSMDGLRQGMCVYESDGVVGVVYRVSKRYALVMPLLNTESNISCRVKGGDCFGFLRWNGGDVHYASLTDLPSRSGVAKGDTIETSGFSSVFPKGLMVGRVSSIDDTRDGGSPEVSVELSVDFSRIEYVYVGLDVVPEELSDFLSAE